MKSLPKQTIKIVVFVLLLIGAATSITWAIYDANKGATVSFSKFEEMIQAREGELFTLKEIANGTLYLTINDELYVTQVPPQSQMVADLVERYNLTYQYSSQSRYGGFIIGGILIGLVILLIVANRLRKTGVGINSMKHSASKASALPDISLADIGGLPAEMKEEIVQALAIVKDPKSSEHLGIKPPKGILLFGPPGTGKTLLAQAIAHEIGATFYSSSGAAFTELFVGVGAARIRSLFQNARKQKPAVIFIDEIDALAGKRKAFGGEETEKTLTELLVQLDGGEDNDGVLFIAATNRKDMLDDAFLRPGRIDFTFQVPLPDTRGRKEIIEIHRKGKRMAEDVIASIQQIAESTSGFSGADIRSLFETASRRAIRLGREQIEQSDIDYAIDRTVLGSTSRALNDKATKRRVAIHESGHALIAMLTKPGSVRKATIIPRGEALGYVAPIPKELHLSTTSELLDQVSMILAGGVAERMFLGEHSIGVSGDVKQAKELIEQMVDIGMLQEGFTLLFNKEDKEANMQALFDEALRNTETLIRKHESEYMDIVHALMKKETLDGDEIEAIVFGKELQKTV